MASEQASQPILYGQYAGFVTRLVAYILDRFIVSGIIAALGLAIRLILDALGLTGWFPTERTGQVIVVLLILAVVSLIHLFYNMGFWVLAGQTPGKRVMGVRIVRTGGQRVTWGNAIRRQVGYWISSILMLGYLWVLLDNRRQGWHDKLAGTMVVYSWPEEGGTPVSDRLQRFRERRTGA